MGENNMHFISEIPCTKGNRYIIYDIVDRLSKSAHILSIRIDYSLECLEKFIISIEHQYH